MRAAGGGLTRAILLAGALALASGCHTASPQAAHSGLEPAPYIVAKNTNTTCFADPRYDESLPRELQKVTMPEMIIEPPDILRIELVRVLPNPDYKIQPGDALFLNLDYTGRTEQLTGDVFVGPDGQISVGVNFGGFVKVTGLSIEEARAAIIKQAIATGVKDPKAQVSLVQSRALVPIRSEFLVRPDGTVGLGTYGDVRLVGQTLKQARATIERHLSQVVLKPEVSVDFAAYNSKLYYVIFDGGGRGQQIVRLPVTGHDTVLDAVAQVNGLSPISSEHHIWVARPSPAAMNQEMVMPVDWFRITRNADPTTNYQLMPGDRIYVKANPLVTTDNWVAMILSPIERIFGVGLLGQTSVQTMMHPSLVGGAR